MKNEITELRKLIKKLDSKLKEPGPDDYKFGLNVAKRLILQRIAELGATYDK